MVSKKNYWEIGFAFIVATLVMLSCVRDHENYSPSISRSQVEDAHGIKLPPSARNFQQRQVGGFPDHGVLSLFEIDQNELQQFTAQLKIKSRNSPAKVGPGNPCLNGWNVWPENSITFVPGNKELDGLRPTWTEEAKPVEMFSCSSPKGDWLHVEIWSIGNHVLIKLYTDWN